MSNNTKSSSPSSKGLKIIKVLVHSVPWIILYIMPLIVFGREEGDAPWGQYIKQLITPTAFVIIFYVNFIFLIKKTLYQKKIKQFFISNFILYLIICGFHMLWFRVIIPDTPPPSVKLIEKVEELQHEIDVLKAEKEDHFIANEKRAEFEPLPVKKEHSKAYKTRMKLRWWHVFTDIFSFICITGLAVAFRFTVSWIESEEKRQEEEKKKAEAELKHLKSQINPHFLFNTLNNIYALIAISQEKAQESVMSLSKMLRYVLYDDDKMFVPIQKEVDFINNYVQLMKLRLTAQTTVNVTTHVEKNPNMPIAPLLFISFIENAFKHGVANNQPSYINFSIEAVDEHTIRCELHNSYFPKSEEHDKSGSGIGIENTRRRLELIYPNAHTFECGVKDNEYYSLLIINTQQQS